MNPFERRRRAGLCITPRCRNTPRHHRRKCNTCRSRQYDDPLRRLFRNLKAHAKARGKTFSLTFEHFAEVAVAGGYDKREGRDANSLTINRKKPFLGYEDGNIEILTNAENVRQRFVDEKLARIYGTQPDDEDPAEEYPY